jgi:hypothetical protein
VASTIKIKRSGVAGKQPNTSTISVGELAINFKDQKLYSSNGTSIFEIGAGGGGGSSNGFSGILVGSNVVVADSFTDRLTFVAGSRVTIAANPTSDTITFAAQTADYLQVANAAAIYQTKAVERAALANTNASIATQATRITLVNTNLTGTNTALRTLINGRATWAALTGTNTALRALISDRLQVANAAAIYQTKAVERAALANTNSSIATQATRITLVNTNLTGTNTALRTLINGRATWAALTGTNTALRTLISDRLQVANAAAIYQTKAVERAALANTNVSIATQATRVTLVNTNLTGTNTALRTLISDRLQVANAAAIYQTKAVERAALANTNSSIATQATRVTLVNTNLTGTNTALRTLISDRLQVANAATLYATKISPTTSGLFAHTGRATISTNLTVSGNTTLGAANKTITTTGLISHTGRATISTNLAVSGNLAITGISTFTGAVTLGGGATNLTTINGRATIGQNLTVSGNTTLGAAGKIVNVPGSLLQLNGTDIRATFAANSYVKSILANTNVSIATQATRITLVNTNLTGTNTALRTLTSARLQVSNSFSSLTVRSANTAAITTISSNVKLNDAMVVNPAGHLQVIISGVTYKIPYFL